MGCSRLRGPGRELLFTSSRTSGAELLRGMPGPACGCRPPCCACCWCHRGAHCRDGAPDCRDTCAEQASGIPEVCSLASLLLTVSIDCASWGAACWHRSCCCQVCSHPAGCTPATEVCLLDGSVGPLYALLRSAGR